jgi:predicted RNA binding protein YcfA (HicA-like mRNA interferase family)
VASKDIRRLITELKAQGFRVGQTRGGHYIAYCPDGVTRVTIPGAPSDHRSMKNVLADLRRCGFKG